MSHDPFDHDEDIGVNPSREPGIADLIEARMSRRSTLRAAAALIRPRDHEGRRRGNRFLSPIDRRAHH